MRIPAFLGTALVAGLVVASPVAAQSGPPPSGYQRPIPGSRVDPYWVAREYYIGTWQSHGWPAPPRGYAWSRYYDDAVLIDGNGTVYDVRYAVAWTKDDPKAAPPGKSDPATGSQASDRDDDASAGDQGARDGRRGRHYGADYPPPPPAPVPPDPGPPPPPFVPSGAPSASAIIPPAPQSSLPTVTVSRPPAAPGMPEPPPPKVTVSQQPAVPGVHGAQTVTTITIEPQPVTTQTEVEAEEAAPEE